MTFTYVYSVKYSYVTVYIIIEISTVRSNCNWTSCEKKRRERHFYQEMNTKGIHVEYSIIQVHRT